MIEKKYIISDDKEVAEVLNKFFVNITSDLKIPASHNCNKDFQKMNDPVLNAISKYKYHPSIVMMKSKLDPQRKFSFTSMQYEDVVRKIKSLNVSKASQKTIFQLKF